MQKIVIDTNIVVSSLIQKGYSYLIVYEIFMGDAIQLCISDELMEEYYDVLSRPRFARFPDFFVKAEGLLAEIEKKAIKFYPTIRLDLITDKDDNKILELAEESKADYVITGNSNDFTFPVYKETKIITPKDYWEMYKPF